MSNISPSDPTYAETFARIQEMLAQEEEDHGSIAEMSEDSLREWLHAFSIRAAEVLSVTAGKVLAMIADYVQIGRNAINTGKQKFRESYEQSRRIRPI